MASEVGSGQVAIFPVFKGMRKSIATEVDGATANAGRRMSRTLGKTGDQAGAAAGRGFRTAFTNTTAGTADGVLRKMTSDVASASKSLSAARLKELDAIGRVRVAETSLAEARSKYAADSSQVVRAEERLAATQRQLTVVQDTVRVSSERLSAAKLSLANATRAADVSVRSARTGFAQFFRSLSSGFRDSREAQSELTGLAGSLGGVLRLAVRPAEAAFKALSFAAQTSFAVAMLSVRFFSREFVSALSVMARFATRVFRSVSAPVISVLSSIGGAVDRTARFFGTRLGAAAARAISAASVPFVQFAAGFRTLEYAVSSATGLMGTFGGRVRAVLDATVASARSFGATVSDGFFQAVIGIRLVEQAIRGRLVAAANTATAVVRRVGSAVASVASSAAVPFQQFAVGFRTSSVQAAELFGVMGVLGRVTRSVFTPAVVAGTLASRAFTRTLNGVRSAALDAVSSFGAGYRSSTAAASAVTGYLGSLGGIARTVTDRVSAAFDLIPARFKNAAATVTSLFRDIGRTAISALGPIGTAATAVGGAIQSAFGTAMAGVKRVTADAAQATQSAFAATATAVAASLAAMLGGGFSRLAQIEFAQAKLRGLGNDAETVAETMKNANAAVLGTSFGLDEAATVAAAAVAAGIKPGRELEEYLRLTADTAAIAGVSFKEMGSIINKATTQGRAYTQELNQLADRGIPIYQLLADKMGVSQEKLREMVAAGEIDAELYRQVLQDKIGGSAVEMGNTTSGAWANMIAAGRRAGAALLGGIFPIFKDVFNTVTSGLNAATAAVAPFAKAIGEGLLAKIGPKLEALRGTFDSFRAGLSGAVPAGFLESITSNLSSIATVAAPVIGALLGALGPLLAKLPLIGGAFAGITGPLGLVIGLITSLLVASPELRAVLGTLFETIGSALGQIGAVLAPVVTQLISTLVPAIATIGAALGTAITAVLPLFTPLVSIITALLPLLTPIAQLVAALATALAGLLGAALTAIMPILLQVADLLVGVIGQAVAALTPVIMALIPIVTQVATVLGEVLGTVLTALAPLIQLLVGFISQLFTALLPVITAVLGLIGPILQLITPLLQLIGAILPPLIQLFVAVLTPIMDLVVVIVNALIPVIEAIIKILTGLINFVTGVFSGNWSQAWNGVKQVFSGIWDAVVAIVTGGIDIIKAIPGKIIEVFAGAGKWLFDIGKNIIQGLIDGVGQLASKAVKAVTDIGGDMVDGVKSFLGIKSPSRVFRYQVGAQIPAGMALGIEDGTSDVQAAVRKMVAVPSGSSSVSVTGSVSGGAGGTSGRVPVTQNITNNFIDQANPVLAAKQANREFSKGLAAA